MKDLPTKQQIRKKFFSQRLGLKQRNIVKMSQQINTHLINLLINIKPSLIGLYKPIKNEVLLTDVIKFITNSQHQICWPFIKHNNLVFQEYSNIDDDIFTAPSENLPHITPDIIVIPLIAADHRKYRIGYGKGYFDRYLASLNHIRLQVKAIGLSYDCQIIEQIATEEFDQPLDMIITDRKIYY